MAGGLDEVLASLLGGGGETAAQAVPAPAGRQIGQQLGGGGQASADGCPGTASPRPSPVIRPVRVAGRSAVPAHRIGDAAVPVDAQEQRAGGWAAGLEQALAPGAQRADRAGGRQELAWPLTRVRELLGMPDTRPVLRLV
ncbi:hypothetical protein [Streptomyces sp. NPDC058678]|uniref:hypothetical protein n=1 Tax=Streptomyces sp. NPDC058678 TaxID=3346595 RepID=UPI003667D8F7